MIAINTKELIKEVTWTKRFCDKHTTIPMLAHLRLTAAAGGKLTISGTNLELYGFSPVDCTADAALDITAPAALLLAFLRTVRSETVTLSVSGWHLTVTGGSNKVSLNGMDPKDFPVPPALPSEMLMELADLHTIGPRLRHAISNEESRFTLNAALIQIDDEFCQMIGTDGHRLTIHPIQRPAGWKPVRQLISREALVEIENINGGRVWMAATEIYQFFMSHNRVLVSRKPTGSFPDWQRVMPKSSAGSCTMDIAEWREALNGLMVFADARLPVVRVKIENGSAVLNAGQEDIGRAESTLAAPGEGPGLEIGLNIQYLLDTMSHAGKDQTEMILEYTGPKNCVVLKTPGDGWATVIMPVRI